MIDLLPHWFYINSNQKISVASKRNLSSSHFCRLAGVALLNSATLARIFVDELRVGISWLGFAQAAGLADSGVSTCYSGVQAEGEAPWWKLFLCQLHEYKRISRNIEDLSRSWLATGMSSLCVLWAITRNTAKAKFQGTDYPLPLKWEELSHGQGTGREGWRIWASNEYSHTSKPDIH